MTLLSSLACASEYCTKEQYARDRALITDAFSSGMLVKGPKSLRDSILVREGEWYKMNYPQQIAFMQSFECSIGGGRKQFLYMDVRSLATGRLLATWTLGALKPAEERPDVTNRGMPELEERPDVTNPGMPEVNEDENRTRQPTTPASPQITRDATITINAAITYQTMDGFGTSERLFDDPHLTETFNASTGRGGVILTGPQQNEILDKLYTELALTRVRIVNPDAAVGSGIEPVNDNSDPNVADLSKFNFGWKNLDDHCEYVKRAQSRSVITPFLSSLNRESWMGVSTPGDAAEYAEWLLAQIKRCDALGVRLPFVSVSNEPSGSANAMSGEFIRDVIKVLGPRLRAEGFNTMFVVPDDIRSSNAAQLARVILIDPAALSYVGALATHLYDEPISHISQMKALSALYSLPLWMTEFSTSVLPKVNATRDARGWSNMMQDLIGIYNVSAVDYMWGFFGQGPTDAALIVLKHRGDAYTGYSLNKEYYVMGQYSRFIKPGAKRIAASSSDSTLPVTAFKDGSKFIIVVLNNQSASKALTIQFSGSTVTTMQPTYTALRGAENWKTSRAIVARAGQFAATVPGESITTFISAP